MHLHSRIEKLFANGWDRTWMLCPGEKRVQLHVFDVIHPLPTPERAGLVAVLILQNVLECFLNFHAIRATNSFKLAI